MITMTDTEIRLKGLQILTEIMGSIEAERFITLIQRERFDYTEWQRRLWQDETVADISSAAMAYRNQQSS